MAQAYREITKWAESSAINHIYLLEGDSMIAYVRQGTTEPHYFKRPIRIDRRGRKFEPVEGIFVSESNSQSNIREVQGSKGQTYIVNLDLGTCTCAGFTFRGSCKHTRELEQA